MGHTMSWEEFDKEVARLIKPYRHLKCKLKLSKFRKFHREGMSPEEAAKWWVLNAS